MNYIPQQLTEELWEGGRKRKRRDRMERKVERGKEEGLRGNFPGATVKFVPKRK